MRDLDQLRDADEIARRPRLQHGGERAFVDRVGGNVADEQGIPVGRRLRGCLERDVAGSAGAIVDHERLAQHFLQLGRKVAGNDVRGAAGRIRDQHLDRSIRIRVGGLRQRRERQQRANPNKGEEPRRARKSGWPIWSNGSDSIHIFPLGGVIATVSSYAAGRASHQYPLVIRSILIRHRSPKEPNGARRGVCARREGSVPSAR